MNPATPLASPFPPDLKRLAPVPRTPWNISSQVFQRIKALSENQTYNTCEILSSDPEFNFVMSYFEHQKPPGYGIKRIFCIHNSNHTQIFEGCLKNMEQESQNPIFASRGKEEEPKTDRARALARWENQAAFFSSFEIQSTTSRTNTFIKAKIFPLWHGSSSDVCQSVCSSGFTFFGKHHYFVDAANHGNTPSTDKGYFGSGIYFTNSARYATMYSSEGHLLLSWVSLREPYPVVNDVPHPQKGSDMKKLEGKEHYQNYNAHFIPVASIEPNNPLCMKYYPCYKDQPPAWDEFVVFDKSQTLPRFWVELCVDFPILSLRSFINAGDLLTLLLNLLDKTEIKQHETLSPMLQKKADSLLELSEQTPLGVQDEKFYKLAKRLISDDERINSSTVNMLLKVGIQNSDLSNPPSKTTPAPIAILPPLLQPSLPTAAPKTTPPLEKKTEKQEVEAPREVKIKKVDKISVSSIIVGHDTIYSLIALPSGNLICEYRDLTIKVWDTHSKKNLCVLNGIGEQIDNIAPISEESFACATDDGRITLWETATGNRLRIFKERSKFIVSLPENILACTSDKKIKLFDIKTGNQIYTLEGHSSPVLALARLPGRRLASASEDKTIKIWDVSTGKCLSSLEGHMAPVSCLTALPNGILVSGSQDRMIRLWDTTTEKCVKIIGELSSVLFLATLNDVIVSGSADKAIRFWDPLTGICLGTLEGHYEIGRTAALPGNILATASGKNIKLQSISFSTVSQVSPLASTSPSLNFAFGKEKWASLLGDVGEEPPLPTNIQKILQGPCPFFPGKKVEETHLLTLIPRTVNGKFLTLNSLEELIKNLKQKSMAPYKIYWHKIKDELGGFPSKSSYWVLLTKDIIPDSRGKSYDAQAKLLTKYCEKAHVFYEAPRLLETTVSILMEYLQKAGMLFSNETYTSCQDKIVSNSSASLVVGGFTPVGLTIINQGGNIKNGIAGALRF